MRDVIVSLGGNTLREARTCAHQFLERTASAKSLDDPGRKRSVPAHALALGRARTRHQVRGTNALRSRVQAVLDSWRSEVLSAIGIREDAGDAAAAVATTQALLSRIDRALALLDPNKLAVEITAIQKQLYELGLKSAAAEVGLSFDLPPERAIVAMQHANLAFARQVVQRQMIAVKDALLAGLDAGDGPAEIGDRIRDVFDDGMHIIGGDGQVARVIPSDAWIEQVARTEVSRAMNAGIFDVYRAVGVEQVMWVAAEDERTCFPAGTLVETPYGPRYIATIEVGDVVATPEGPKNVTEVLCRPFEGAWTFVEWRAGQLLCTGSHPVWTQRGWVPAFDLVAGDLLQAVDNEFREVIRRTNFTLAEAHDVPTTSGEEPFLVSVSFLSVRSAMPIGAVDLDCDSRTDDREVDRVSANAVLLLESEAEDLEGDAEVPLEAVLAPIAAIAAERAESPIPAGANAELPVAGGTGDELHGPSAGLGAVRPICSTCSEVLAAPIACPIERICQTASARTDAPSVRGRRWDGEDLGADWAALVDALARERVPEALPSHRFGPAGPRAELCLSGHVSARELRAALLANADPRHASSIAKALSGRTNVWNLEVGEAHVFFAEGVLVHNCPLCDEADGSVVNIGQPFPGVDADTPPGHVSCRCTTVSVGYAGGSDAAAA